MKVVSIYATVYCVALKMCKLRYLWKAISNWMYDKFVNWKKRSDKCHIHCGYKQITMNRDKKETIHTTIQTTLETR